MPKPKVLFICLGNSCRSIMAEALARHRCGDRWEAASAGINPLGFVTPETLEVLAEMGVSVAGLHSKGLSEFDLREYRLLINLSDHSLQGRIPPDGAIRVLPRWVPDPYGCGLEVYRRSRDAIQQVIIRELCREEEPRP
ncbi:MAG: arsenate reductase ArsC [Syntrophales bacterium]|nr:arsenate reductase ArsC [Syntrophales bacterium]